MAKSQKLNALITSVLKQNGSDLHLTEGRKPVMRAFGELLPMVKEDELNRSTMHEYIDAFLGAELKDRLLKNREVDFGVEITEGRLRGHAFFQRGKLGISLRFISKDVFSFEDLNLPPILSQFAKKKQGFFLVAGPTGHGKSTTLSAMINLVNKERLEHIITIEDPIEYLFTPDKSIIDQREVYTDAKDFQTALKGVFRQDADVVMIGEMRDAETMSTAVTAAETGHLVFSTLHTNTAAQTVERVIDSFDSTQQNQIKMQLANTLTGIFSQRLIPRISGGRIPAYELLINNNAVANLIRDNRVHEIDTVIETGADQGMMTMNRSLVNLVHAKEITVENAHTFSPNPNELEKLL
jgi:twitching motility protein PilT